ncbi:uncharacterized protein FFB20_07565 [Fusarium fujikuroi]|uniref:DUF6594 domain-containing protein n=1 Tax=Gibberella fujikuroi (strain CBS 195.34 / IMI 58289 / NRRL A-6831) TaxID=1279085 RepID=S0DZC8_GIBF5|nr:uncharacterized protein FFUJ_02816 [Fusarium fujikuroi IMI 58289]KLO80068.1 uncharacterized protein LW93_7514 [Fusarium fujikuroi]KLP01213.1 uncharacterized protein Y057_6481 [Fusarium fujikuroi]QGI62016.1 hypothetical protein CEK27_005987 [Fusarium fujikuroi]QGI79192.1 hypothetical protein CEK25_005921 [Fusarium fujikuroi]QGI92912.1 hypothetical protein CEK26_005981 [Fusarium fujikuroi]
MSQPCQMNAPQGSSVGNPVSGPPRSEEVNTPSIMRPGIDLERQAGNWGGERGWARMCRQMQQDKRHMVAPRLSNISSRCIMLQANRMVTLYDEAKKAFESGREDANTNEKLVEEYLKYSQVLIQTSQVLALDKPGSYFLRNLLPSFRAMLKGEGGKYLDAPIHDWASLSQPDRLDQLICLAGYTRVGRVLLTPFLSGQEEVGDNDQYLYNEGAIRFISITIFSSIIALFACAPAAIQSLNVRSTVGEVVVYLVFVIVFGWISQGLILGFEKVLLSCLAYAGLMATLLRGG